MVNTSYIPWYILVPFAGFPGFDILCIYMYILFWRHFPQTVAIWFGYYLFYHELWLTNLSNPCRVSPQDATVILFSVRKLINRCRNMNPRGRSVFWHGSDSKADLQVQKQMPFGMMWMSSRTIGQPMRSSWWNRWPLIHCRSGRFGMIWTYQINYEVSSWCMLLKTQRPRWIQTSRAELVHSSRRLTEIQWYWYCFDLHQCIFVQFSSYAHERQDKMIQHVQTTDMHMAHWHVCMAIVLPGISEWKSTYNSWRYGCLEILDLKGLKPEGTIFVSPICASETRKLAVHWGNRGWSQISRFSSLQNLFGSRNPCDKSGASLAQILQPCAEAFYKSCGVEGSLA